MGNVGRLRSWGDVNQTLHCFNKATLTKEWISLSCFSSFYPQGPFPCSTASFHFSHLSVSLCANKCKLHAIVFETAARGKQVFHINLCMRPLNHVSRRGTPHTEHLCVNLNLRRQRTAREKKSALQNGSSLYSVTSNVLVGHRNNRSFNSQVKGEQIA